jgi:hypothetical protein
VKVLRDVNMFHDESQASNNVNDMRVLQETDFMDIDKQKESQEVEVQTMDEDIDMYGDDEHKSIPTMAVPETSVPDVPETSSPAVPETSVLAVPANHDIAVQDNITPVLPDKIGMPLPALPESEAIGPESNEIGVPAISNIVVLATSNITSDKGESYGVNEN